MYQGTTPVIPVRFDGADLSLAKVYLSLYDEKNKELYTFESGNDFTVEKDGDDSVTYLHLTQEQTLALGVGTCTFQARWIFSDGSAGATQKARAYIQDVLQKGVISYE